jgi:hypothetical protein
MREKAIEFVMNFYNIPRSLAVDFYEDEIEAYEQFLSRLEKEN